MRKNNEGLYSIGTVASLCGISRKRILDYEELGLIHPTAVDSHSGYRYYDIPAISRLQILLDLRETGLPLREIGGYLDGTLSAEEKLAALENQRRRIDAAIADIRLRSAPSEPPRVEPIAVPGCRCLCKEHAAADFADCARAYAADFASIAGRGVTLARCAYHFCEYPGDVFSPVFYQYEGFPFRTCFCIEPERAPADAVDYPPCRALSLVYRGEYAGIFDAYGQLTRHMRLHCLRQAGPARELYIEGLFSGQSSPPVTRILIPIE